MPEVCEREKVRTNGSWNHASYAGENIQSRTKQGAERRRPVTEPSVEIIILNWNRLRDTVECLESVFKIRYSNYSVVVVDNGSDDESAAGIEKAFDQVLVIRNKDNLGYAEGNNVGIRHAIEREADYIWLLNNDAIVDRDALIALVELAERDRGVGILGSKIYYFDQPDVLWFAGATIDWKRSISPHIGRLEKDIGQYERETEVDRVTGCSMLIRREVFEEVGMFDEKFFLYDEEVDLCVRARARGYRNCYVPKSVVHHKISVSSGENSVPIYAYYHTRNFLYLIRKNIPFPRREYYLARSVARVLVACKGTICRLILPGLFPKDAVTPIDMAPLVGLWHFFAGKMGKGDFSPTS
ncbi:MAG: glycosyltransferase family 2 protein [Deltaproteobacteria bacterium]|nr:MAG: glycosyltransferase family 2 protein [Deltaproteobacteria bacterium]